MPEQDTVSILLDVKSRLEELDKTVRSMGNLRDQTKNAKDEAQGLAALFKQGLAIDVARRGMDLLTGSLRQFVAGSFQMAGQVKDQSEALGLSTEAYQVLGEVIRDVGGDQAKLVEMVATNNRSLIEARTGAGNAAQAYRELGLSASELEGLTVERRFEAIGKAVLNASDQTKAFGAAGHLVGTRQLPVLLNMLKQLGGEGYDNLAGQIGDAGRIMSDDTIARLDKAQKAIEKLKQQATIAVGEAIGDVMGDSDPSGAKDIVSGAGKAWQWVVASARNDAEFIGKTMAAASELWKGFTTPGSLDQSLTNTRLAWNAPEEARLQAWKDATAREQQRKDAEAAAEAQRKRDAESAAEKAKQIEDTLSAETEINKVLLDRATLQNDPNQSPEQKRPALLKSLQEEIALRDRLIELTKAAPDDGKPPQVRALAIAQLEAQAAAARNQQKALQDAAADFSRLEKQRDAEVDLARVIAQRKEIESAPDLTAEEKRAALIKSLERELELRAEILLHTRNKPLENVDGAQAARDKTVDALTAEINTLRNQLAAQKGNAAYDTRQRGLGERALGTEDPLVNKNYVETGDGLGTGMMEWAEGLGSRGEQLADTMRGTLGSAVSEISDGIWGWLEGTSSFGDALINLGDIFAKSLIQTIVQMGVQWLVQQAVIEGGILSISGIMSLFRKKDAAETVATEGAKTPLLATNAGLASVGSFGVAAALGLAALLAVLAVFSGMREQGGPVTAGRAYVVGEKRPEVFVPNQSGTILPSVDALEGLSLPAGDQPSALAGNVAVAGGEAGGLAAIARQMAASNRPQKPSRTIVVDERRLAERLRDDPDFKSVVQDIITGDPGAFGINS
ncbi:hypothetical protein OPIT5_08375 [Opitutaceae bacterium TAV5]|nr:hypothetical protein OPIT5_08375 [Opitutaceae bacterium TAV5]